MYSCCYLLYLLFIVHVVLFHLLSFILFLCKQFLCSYVSFIRDKDTSAGSRMDALKKIHPGLGLKWKKTCVRVPLLVNNACTWCCWCRTCMRCTFYVQRKAHVCVVVLSIMTEDVTWRWKSPRFLFSLHKKYSRSFVKLLLNHWCRVSAGS